MWILHLITTYNLLPRAGHRDEVTYMNAYMIFYILQGIPFNFAHIVLAHMFDALTYRAKSLPYDTILCHIYSSRGITASSTKILSVSSGRLIASTLRKMGYKTDEQGQWLLKHPLSPRAIIVDVPESSRTWDISLALQQLQLSIEGRLDRMQAEFNALQVQYVLI